MQRMPWSAARAAGAARTLGTLAVLVLVAGCVVFVVEEAPPAPPPKQVVRAPVTPPRQVIRAPVVTETPPAPRPPVVAARFVAVPPLAGLPYEWAAETLAEYDLLVGEIDYRESTKSPGTVLAHRPGPGQTVSVGSRVRLTLARARTVESMATVPTLVGLSETQARSALERTGFEVGTVTYEFSSTAGAPAVGGQSPAAGGLAYPGAGVDIVVRVYRPPERTPVPGLVGMARMEAMRAIGEAGLRHAGTSYSPGGGAPADQVLSQTPPARTLVEPGSGVTLVVSSGADRVTVPNVVGRTAASAIAQLRRAGLRASVSHTSAVGRPNRVVSQDPGAGAFVARGKVVRLVATRPAVLTQKVVVPEVTGRRREEAEALVRSAGLSPGKIRYRPGSAGFVLQQIPAAGTVVEKGSTVALVVGKRGVARPVKKRVRIPDLAGRTRAEAEAELVKVGLALGSVTTGPGRSGVVVGQRPAAGVVVMVGFKVSVVVGRAAVPRKVAVPNVVGMRQGRTPGQGEVAATLRTVGLRLGRVTQRQSPGRPGVVLTQSPAAGTLVDKGSAVDVVVSERRGQQVTVPSVVGMRHDVGAAGRRLTAAGLRLGRVAFAAGTSGVVLSQSPAAGKLVARGSAVDLTVGRASDTKVGVPRLTGMRLGRATAALRKAGLSVGAISYVSGAKANEVVRQSPSAGAKVDRGTRVRLVVTRRESKPEKKPDKKPEKKPEKRPDEKPKDEAEQVRVPNVVRLTFGAAGKVLRDAGLSVGKVSRRKVKKAKKNSVLSQSPRAGTTVKKGSGVDLIVAK